MHKKLLLLFICSLSIQSSLYSQFPKTWKKIPFDTSYIRTYPNAVSVYLPLTAPYLKFVFKDIKSGNHLDFEPTKKYNLGIGVKFGVYTLIIGTGISFFKENEEKQGKTKYTDIQMLIMPRRFANDFYYQKYKGFHVRNSADFTEYKSDKPYLIRPDIQSNLLVLNTNYIFNYRKFSFKNSFGFNETQLKSSGSFLAGAYCSFFNQTGDSAIVTLPFTSYFSSDGSIQKSTEQTYGLSAGYIYTWIILKKFHATVMLAEGGGFYRIKYALFDKTKHSGPLNLSAKTNLRLSLGYDTGKIIIGAMSIYDNYYFRDKSNSVINFRNGKFRIYAGYRFGKKQLLDMKDKVIQ